MGAPLTRPHRQRLLYGPLDERPGLGHVPHLLVHGVGGRAHGGGPGDVGELLPQHGHHVLLQGHVPVGVLEHLEQPPAPVAHARLDLPEGGGPRSALAHHPGLDYPALHVARPYDDPGVAEGRGELLVVVDAVLEGQHHGAVSHHGPRLLDGRGVLVHLDGEQDQLLLPGLRGIVQGPSRDCEAAVVDALDSQPIVPNGRQVCPPWQRRSRRVRPGPGGRRNSPRCRRCPLSLSSWLCRLPEAPVSAGPRASPIMHRRGCTVNPAPVPHSVTPTSPLLSLRA